MPSVLAYHRPASLDEASALLANPNRRVIGGGTVVVPDVRANHDSGVEFVDLQGLGLTEIASQGDEMSMGAMVRLGDLLADPSVPEVLRELARHELPSALRNQATIGGTVATADPESVLLAGLLAYEAVVHAHGDEPMPLQLLLEQGVGARLVTHVSFNPSGNAAWAATGRTPMDVPIVAAVAHQGLDGPQLVLTGVGQTPVVVSADNPTASLSPASDFRGTADYRRRIAEVLASRALEGIGL